MGTDRLAALRTAVADLRARRAADWGFSPPARHAEPRCASGLAALDAVLGGGFVRGNIHELVTSPLLARSDGAAAHTVALLTATRAVGRRGWLLYLDATGDFYPPAAGRLGVPLDRLVVVRATNDLDALWVCEQALHSRGVAAVVAPLPRLDTYASRRLQLAAEAGGGLGLLIRSEPRAPGPEVEERCTERTAHTGLESSAQLPPRRLARRVLNSGPALNSTRVLNSTFAFTRIRFDPLVGDTEARRMLVTVLKLREGRPPEPFVMELPDDGWGTPSVWMPGGGRACGGDAALPVSASAAPGAAGRGGARAAG